MADNENCSICGQPYGECDIPVHRKRAPNGYTFDVNRLVETKYFRQSFCPVLTKPKEPEGQEVAIVA